MNLKIFAIFFQHLHKIMDIEFFDKKNIGLEFTTGYCGIKSKNDVTKINKCFDYINSYL